MSIALLLSPAIAGIKMSPLCKQPAHFVTYIIFVKNSNLSERINSGLSDIDVRYNAETGAPEWSPRGADTWSPFNGNSKIVACFSWYYEGNSQSDYQPHYLNPKIDNANVIQVSVAKTSGPGTKVTLKNISPNTLHITAMDSNSSKIMVDADLPTQSSESFNSPRGVGYAWLL